MSTQRRCDIRKATDGKWYMLLGNFEYAEEQDDCTWYGPFNSEDGALKELEKHSNPGGYSTDSSGIMPPPKNPRRTQTQSFGRVGFRRRY